MLKPYTYSLVVFTTFYVLYSSSLFHPSCHSQKCCRFTDFNLDKLKNSSTSISETRRKFKKLTLVDLESIHQKLEEAIEVRFVDPTKLCY